MARKGKKKKGPVGIFFAIIGWILLLAIIAAVVCFFMLKKALAEQPLDLDDIEKCISAEPTGTAEHLSFSPDAEMTLTLDKNDLWWFIDKELGEGWMDDLNKDLSSFRLKVTGLGLHISESSIDMDVEAYLKDMRLAATVHCRLTCVDGELSVKPYEVTILDHTFTVKQLTDLLKLNNLKLSRKYTPELTFMSGISSVHCGDSCVSITGPMATDYLKQHVILHGRVLIMRSMQPSNDMIGYVYNKWDEDPKICFEGILPRFVEDPENFTLFLDQLFSVKPSAAAEFAKPNHGLVSRWFPDLKEDYSQEMFNARDEYEFRLYVIKSLAKYITDRYEDRKLTVKAGELLYERKAPYDHETFFGDNFSLYSSIINFDSCRMILYSHSSVGYSGSPVLSSICDKAESLYGIPVEPDLKLSYAPALVYRGADGFCWVTSFPEGGFQIIEISEDEYNAIMTCEDKVPVLYVQGILD